MNYLTLFDNRNLLHLDIIVLHGHVAIRGLILPPLSVSGQYFQPKVSCFKSNRFISLSLLGHCENKNRDREQFTF